MENDRASEPRSAWIDRAERLLSEQGRDRRFGGIRVAAARLLGTAAVLVTVIVSGCGGDDGDDSATPPPPPPPATTAPTPPPSGEGTTLENPADAGGDLEFQKDSLTAPAGTITLVMFNPSSEVHNISVEGEGVDEKGELVGEGETSRVTVVLEPGEYTFYCSVPLHRDGGMEGTLTVTG